MSLVNIILLIVLIVGVLFIFGIYIWLKIKKMKKVTNNIPADVLELFNEAERRMNENRKQGSQTSGNKILYELANFKPRAAVGESTPIHNPTGDAKPSYESAIVKSVVSEPITNSKPDIAGDSKGTGENKRSSKSNRFRFKPV